MKKTVMKNAGILMIMALLCSAFPALAQNPDLLVCSDKGYTLTNATAAAGTNVTYKWYQKVNDGTFSEVSGKTDASLQCDVTNAAGTYQYVRVVSGDNCPDGVPSNTYTVVVLKPTVPTISVGTAEICQNSGDVVFTVASADNTTYTWTGTTGTSSGAGHGTYTVSGADYGKKEVQATASVEYSINSMTKTCTSSASSAAEATVNPMPVVASASTYDICGSGEKTLTVTVKANDGNSITGETIISWYNESAGTSTALHTGTSYNPNLTATTSYYVKAVADTGCESDGLTEVKATISLYEGKIGGVEN